MWYDARTRFILCQRAKTNILMRIKKETLKKKFFEVFVFAKDGSKTLKTRTFWGIKRKFYRTKVEIYAEDMGQCLCALWRCPLTVRNGWTPHKYWVFRKLKGVLATIWALRKMLCKQYLTTFDKVKITGISLIKSVNNNYWFLPQDRIRQCWRATGAVLWILHWNGR